MVPMMTLRVRPIIKPTRGEVGFGAGGEEVVWRFDVEDSDAVESVGGEFWVVKVGDGESDFVGADVDVGCSDVELGLVSEVVGIDEEVVGGLFVGLLFTIDVVISIDVTVTTDVMTTIDVSGGGGAKACRSSSDDIEDDENRLVLSAGASFHALVATSAAVRGKCMI
jgi:hypothetical protein